MAEGSPEISAEAFARVERERDALKTQVADAAKALKDIALERKLAEHYGAKGYANPLAVANRALTALRDVPDDELTVKADSWYEEQRKLFAPSESEPTTPAPESPWQQAVTPIPTGGRVPATGEPLVAGTPAFVSWVQGKSMEQVKAAVRNGDVVIPEKVKLAQNTMPFGG